MKINTDTIGVFTGKTLNPKISFTPSSDFTIAELYPEAIRAISVYHDGPDIIRIDIPIDVKIRFTRAGGGGSRIGGAYNLLQF
jgi:hypothetical protein